MDRPLSLLALFSLVASVPLLVAAERSPTPSTYTRITLLALLERACCSRRWWCNRASCSPLPWGVAVTGAAWRGQSSCVVVSLGALHVVANGILVTFCLVPDAVTSRGSSRRSRSSSRPVSCSSSSFPRSWRSWSSAIRGGHAAQHRPPCALARPRVRFRLRLSCRLSLGCLTVAQPRD